MDICIYHGGCTDGVAAAWAIWRRYPEALFVPGVYQKEPIDVTGKNVLLVDFSYKRPVLERMAEQAKSVTILDHHATAKDDLEPLLADGTIKGEFDMDRCGALMAWDWAQSPPYQPRPGLLHYIDAQDRWTDERDPVITLAIRSYPDSMEAAGSWVELMKAWSSLMRTPIRDLRSEGVPVYRYYRLRVEEAKRQATAINIGDFQNVPCVNAPYSLASDVAGELAEGAPDGIACVWWLEADGDVVTSLRSIGYVHVGDLAVEYGGGGHHGAAGFRTNLSAIRTMLHSADSI